MFDSPVLAETTQCYRVRTFVQSPSENDSLFSINYSSNEFRENREAALAAKQSSRKSVGQGPPIGYARVSTEDQNLALQLDALKRIGCERVFTDKVGGAKVVRPGLTDALSHLRAGDTLVVWKLDRLGRSVKELRGGSAFLDSFRGPDKCNSIGYAATARG